MKQITFALLILSTIGFISCRKAGTNIDIKTYDAQQMQAYISTNGLTGMQKDLVGGDTTGIYYQILSPGVTTSVPMDYPDEISYVYTVRSFDGAYIQSDTVINHSDNLLGHIEPYGLQLSMLNDLKYKGGKMRVLIPSHLAYGISGVGRGNGSTINGNQCLDYTVSVISNKKLNDQNSISTGIQDQANYDDMVINNYMKANTLSGYSKTVSGMYYKIIKQGSSSPDSVITDNSSVTLNYTGQLMNNTFFDNGYASTNKATFSDLKSLTTGAYQGLKLITGGGAISLLIPSKLAYGTSGTTGIPPNACLRFEFSNVHVTN